MDRIRRIESFARAGYLARGIVYILLSYFALTTANVEDGPTGIFREILDSPGGTFLLVLLGLGLAGYGIFRMYGAALNLEGKGSDWKGRGARIGHAASGVAHLVMAGTALQLATGSTASGSAGGGGQQEAAGTVLTMPLGSVMLGIIGLFFLAAAAEQAKKAWSGNFMAKLDARAPEFTEIVGRIGYASRVVTFAIIGVSIIQAAWFSSSAQVEGIGGALERLSGSGLPYTLVAIGLFFFGVFSVVMARYRRIRNEDVITRLKQVVA